MIEKSPAIGFLAKSALSAGAITAAIGSSRVKAI
jgi:hypothetical protein